MSAKLERHQVAERMQTLPQWTLNGDQIERLLNFANFVDAMIFVNRVAELAEEEGHHPEIRVVYNRVTLILSTHDAGGLTEKDFRMARRIEEIGS
jgi:4a-hydroxytetrahydrobiopterin dehydratase